MTSKNSIIDLLKDSQIVSARVHAQDLGRPWMRESNTERATDVRSSKQSLHCYACDLVVRNGCGQVQVLRIDQFLGETRLQLLDADAESTISDQDRHDLQTESTMVVDNNEQSSDVAKVTKCANGVHNRVVKRKREQFDIENVPENANSAMCAQSEPLLPSAKIRKKHLSCAAAYKDLPAEAPPVTKQNFEEKKDTKKVKKRSFAVFARDPQRCVDEANKSVAKKRQRLRETSDNRHRDKNPSSAEATKPDCGAQNNCYEQMIKHHWQGLRSTYRQTENAARSEQ